MWPFLKKAKHETKSNVLGTTHELGSFLMFGHSGSATTAASALSLYGESTAVSIPINMVAEAFASIEPIVKIAGKLVTDHPVLELLCRPSSFFTQDLFLETLAKQYLITANAYVVAVGSTTRPPLELQPISPSNITNVEGGQGFTNQFLISDNLFPGSYTISQSNGAARYFNGRLRELKQIRGFSTQNNSMLRGRSLLASASAEVRQHILGNTHNVSMLEKGGRVSLVFHFQEDLGSDDFAATRENIIREYGSASKAGTIGVTSGGKLDIKELGTNNKDMDFANLQAMAKQAVALQYKVPLPLITTDAATFSNYKEAKLALFDDAVLPLADRIFDGLTDMLMPRYGDDPKKVKITYNLDTITALAVRRNEELKLRRELNLESLNELRSSIGREEVQGGDQVLAPANMIPIGTDLFTDDNLPLPDEDPGLARDNNDV